MRFEDVHRGWLAHLPPAGFALDVGAGSGRDAAALARRGWEVLAVEPAAGQRALGAEATKGLSVQWLDDKLPELAAVRTLSYRFNLILVSAVWMHLPPTKRERAFRVLAELLAPGGVLVISLRHGARDSDRTFHPVDRQELEQFAQRRALLTAAAVAEGDRLLREDVRWETLVFRLPDDGTGALPLLRHVIVNDNKASTYKLGLLRALTRIADGLPGMILKRSDDWVELPLGLVALYWIKLYQPLILTHKLRQAPGSSGYGFATKDFYALAAVSPLDLRVGRTLGADLGPVVRRAIRAAARNITDMPARYTTWPAGGARVFESSVAATHIKAGSTRLDRETLALFGTFRVPTLLWDCFSRYACWLEPAIVTEWTQLMQGYDEVREGADVYQRALAWEEGRRDTTQVRQIVEQRLESNQLTRCVWSRSGLRRGQYHIDHCFPWSRWNNNDLWNLLPATDRANSAKAEKLPAAPLLETAKPVILDWWREAFVGQEREEQFYMEAEGALPLVQHKRTLETVFEGLLQQRLRLKMNQQLVEWMGLG